MHNVMKNILNLYLYFHLLMFLSWAVFPRSYTLRGLSVSDGLSDLWSMPFIKTLWDLSG